VFIPRVTRFLTRKVLPPPAGRKKPDLFHKKIHVVNFFVKKEKRTMLPQANRVFTG
jgi:hypothetical protein